MRRINVTDPLLWVNGSQGFWVKGASIIATPSLADNLPFVVKDQHNAWALIRHQKQVVVTIFETLLMWRTVEITQLPALTKSVLPDFSWDTPNVYGALLRLGVINIGFDSTGMLTGKPRAIFLSIGSVEVLNKRFLKQLHIPAYMNTLLNAPAGRLTATRQATMHNVLTAHVGVEALTDKRVQAVAGDGMSSFRMLTPSLSTVSNGAGGDMTIFFTNGVSMAVEVQRTTIKLLDKMSRWLDALAQSDMRERGLLCVWLLPRNVTNGAYASVQSYVDKIRELPVSGVADSTGVLAGSRMGVVEWDTWFDSYGRLTDRFGFFVDVFGHERYVMDFAGSMPIDWDKASHWGFRQVDSVLGDVFHVDTSMWSHPECLAGGLGGLTVRDGRTRYVE